MEWLPATVRDRIGLCAESNYCSGRHLSSLEFCGLIKPREGRQGIMAYIPQLEPGEQLLVQIALRLSEKSKPFHFAVSNRALFLPATKLLAISDPFYFQKVPLDQVEEVAVRRLRPYKFWLVAAAMIVVSALTSVDTVEAIIKHERVSKHTFGDGYPFALIVGGFILPFVAKGRFGLQVTMLNKSFNWKPPMVVDKASKEQIAETLDDIFEACRQTGLRIVDDRRK
jgi:hypothetical protein